MYSMGKVRKRAKKNKDSLLDFALSNWLYQVVLLNKMLALLNKLERTGRRTGLGHVHFEILIRQPDGIVKPGAQRRCFRWKQKFGWNHVKHDEAQVGIKIARRNINNLRYADQKEISPGISLEGKMLKLKLRYLGHLMRRTGLIGKDSDAGRDWGQEEKGTTEDEMAG